VQGKEEKEIEKERRTEKGARERRTQKGEEQKGKRARRENANELDINCEILGRK